MLYKRCIFTMGRPNSKKGKRGKKNLNPKKLKHFAEFLLSILYSRSQRRSLRTAYERIPIMENENEFEEQFGCTQIDDTIQHQFSGTQEDSDGPELTGNNNNHVNDSSNNIANNDYREDENIVEVDERIIHEKQVEVEDKVERGKEENDDDDEDEDDDDEDDDDSQDAKAVPKMAITQDLHPFSPVHLNEEGRGNSNQQLQHDSDGVVGASSAQKSDAVHEDADNNVNEEVEDGVNRVQEMAIEERNTGTLVNAADVDEGEEEEKEDEEEDEDDDEEEEEEDEEDDEGAKAVPKMAITQDLNPFSPAHDRKNRDQDDDDDEDDDAAADDDDDDAAADDDDDTNREGNDDADHNNNNNINNNDDDDDDELLHDNHNDPLGPSAADEHAAGDMAGTGHEKGSAAVLLTGSSTAVVILTGSSTTSGRGAGDGHMTNDNTCLDDPYGGSSPTQYTPGLPLPAPKPHQRQRGPGPSPGPGAAHAGGASSSAGIVKPSEQV